MNDIALNAISAATIGGVIVAMAATRNSVAKAIIYGLPVPVTVLLIATGGVVTSHHIIGLFLLNLFLWSVWFTYQRWHNIYLSDALGAATYGVLGYGLITFVEVSFFAIVAAFAVSWLLFALLYRERLVDTASKSGPAIPLTLKFAVTASLAFVMLSMKSLFGGVIVTFPFAGVFAVIEGEKILKIIAVSFTQNSLALLLLFVAIRASDGQPLGLRIAFGWAVYLLVLMALNRLFARAKPAS